MNERLKQFLKKTKITGETCMIDTYNQSVYEDVACTITTRVNASCQHFIIEKDTPMKGNHTDWKIIEVRAIGRERTEEEKKRRRVHGDKGANFPKESKCVCLAMFPDA